MARNQSSSDPAIINLIGEGSEVEGTMRSSNDVRVNGRINGELNVGGKVIIADKGIVDGTLVATYADIAGTVLGDLIVEERLILKSTARIEGSIRTGRLVVEEGASFDGSCDMGRLEPKRKELLANAAAGEARTGAAGEARTGPAGEARTGPASDAGNGSAAIEFGRAPARG